MNFLPTTKSVKRTSDPRNLILFGLPKVGKTTALSKLPNALILDLEDGTDYIEGAYVIKIKSYVDMYKAAKALREEQHGFKFVIIDTVTALEEISLNLACKRYKESIMGKNWDGNGNDILKLPQGGGYYWLRIAMQEIIGWFTDQSYNLILTGHVKERNMVEGGTELVVKNLDLGGKMANILAAKSDGIAYLYRDVDTGALMANFGDMNAILT